MYIKQKLKPNNYYVYLITKIYKSICVKEVLSLQNILNLLICPQKIGYT